MRHLDEVSCFSPSQGTGREAGRREEGAPIPLNCVCVCVCVSQAMQQGVVKELELNKE